MAHAISIRKNGFAEMAYVGETPWHGLGQRVEEGADIDTWVKAAGMDWKLARSRVRFGEGPNQQVFEDRHVIFRSDTKAPLSVVSADYKIVQPRQVIEFFADLVGDNGFVLDTAGVLFDGRKLWAQAKIGASAMIVGEDEVVGRLLLATSCDGSMATSARFVTERVVCANTLGMAMNERAKRVVSIRHSGKFVPGQFKDRLGIARQEFGVFVDAARALARVRVDNRAAQKFVSELLVSEGAVTAKDERDLAANVRDSAAYRKILGLFQGSAMGGTLVSAEGTAWGVVNAVTEYVDHHAKAASASLRMDKAWFGAGDQLKTAAFSKALALV